MEVDSNRHFDEEYHASASEESDDDSDSSVNLPEFSIAEFVLSKA